MDCLSPAEAGAARLRRWAGRSLAISLLWAMCLALLPSPVGAQDDATDDGSTEPTTAPEAEPAGTLRLVAHSAAVSSDGVMELVVDWNGPVSDELFLSVLFHQRIDSGAAGSEPTASVLKRVDPVPLSSIATDVDGNYRTAVPVRSVTPGPDERVYLPGPGVYPFTVELRTLDGTVASITSQVVRLPQDPTELAAIDVAVVLAISPADGLDLSDAMWFLTNYPDIPFTIQLDEGTLTQLQNDPPLAEQLAAAAGRRTAMSDAGLNLDPSALVEIGQGRFFLDAFEATNRRLELLGLQVTDQTVMLETRLTADGAAFLTANGITSVLHSNPISTEPGAIATPSGLLQIVQPDRQLTRSLANPDGPGSFNASYIYEIYSELALRAAAGDRGSVIVGGEGVRPLDSQALDTFLPALVSSPDGPVRAVSLAAAIAGQSGSPVQPAERPEQDLVSSGEAVAELQRIAETSRAFRGIQNPDLDQLILDSLSRTRNPVDRDRAIERAKLELTGDLDSITLPPSQSLTLTSADSPLPLTIRNDADGPRLVRLEFIGDRVSIAEDGTVVTVDRGETTIELHAQARALGVSTVEVVASTPDGAVRLATTSYRIRSTAVPGLGWAVSGTALVFLLVWWIRHARDRRPRRPHLTGVPKPIAGIGATGPHPGSDVAAATRLRAVPHPADSQEAV